jgi:Colicin V production protein.
MGRVLDLALIAIIVICAWAGYKKGIIMGIGGILAIVVALYLANLVSITFSYEVIPALRPFVSGYMEGNYKMAIYDELGIELPPEEESGRKIMDTIKGIFGDDSEETVATPTPSPSPTPAISYNRDERLSYSLEDLMNQNPGIDKKVYLKAIMSIGIFAKPANIISDEVIEYEEKNSEGRFESLVSVLCNKVTYVLGYMLSFFMILIIFTVAGNLLNLSFKIPGLDLLNDIIGAVFGVLTGMMFCVVIAWMLKFTGAFISEEKVGNSALAMWFMGRDILGGFLGI